MKYFFTTSFVYLGEPFHNRCQNLAPFFFSIKGAKALIISLLTFSLVLYRRCVREFFKWLSGNPAKPKQLLRPITTGANSAVNQSQFLAIICNSLKAREESRIHGAIGFGLGSHWLKNWRESFKPITKHGNRNHVITFASHVKNALSWINSFYLWSC